MANMWSGKRYWENFRSFSDRSKAAGITESNLEKGEVLTNSSSHTRTLQGKPPSTDAAGNPVPAKTSDSSKIQYGTNYSWQEGDSISVQEGNKSSTQSQGWSNSVMHGLSFSTTNGGSFATTGGFSLATHAGFKMATFIGGEVTMNESLAVKVAGGFVQEVFKTSKGDVTFGEHTSLKGTVKNIYGAASDLYNSRRAVSLVDDNVSGERRDSSLGMYFNVSGSFSLSAAESEQIFGKHDVKSGSLSETVLGSRKMVASSTSIDSFITKIG